MRGVQHDEETWAKFRASFLLTGNASKSGKEVGIPASTANDYVRKLRDDPTFAQDRQALRAGYLAELEALRMSVARTAAIRAKKKSGDIYTFGEGGTVVDKRSEWAKVVLDAEKNAVHALRSSEPEAPIQRQPIEVHIHGPTGTTVEPQRDTT